MLHTYSGDTLTVAPLVKRDRLPSNYRIIIKNGVSYAEAQDIFKTMFELGTIPAGYKMVKKDQYQITFKTITPAKRSGKKRK